MTRWEEARQRLNIALSELEEALEFFDDDEAYTLFIEFEGQINRVFLLTPPGKDYEHPR
jgi:hypothetical protein